MPAPNTTRPHRALQAVPDPSPATTEHTPAEDKLWAALHTHPGSTTAELAGHAGIGRSTAGKILAAWALDGSVTRTPGTTPGPRRPADTWTIPDTTPAPALDDTPAHQPEPDPTDHPAHPTAPRPPTSGPQAGPAKNGRLGKGELRGMVEDYLTEHPGQHFSPSALGQALGRSSGAVANALDKLTANGYAIQTQDKPKRFTAPPVAPDRTGR